MAKHTKAMLVSNIAKRVGESKKTTAAVVTAFIEEIQKALRSGDKVSLVGFGTYGVRMRAARKGKNPRTRQTLSIPAKVVPYFKAGKGLKDLVKNTKVKA
jgi:DNA-binding protein HU-beta